MKIAIIGAGAAGLVTLRYALEHGHECIVFEQTGELGGTWVYSDQYGTDEFGFPACRTMYKGLITLAPKEMMEFLDFSYPNNIKRSYITQLEVLQYLQNYASKYKLEKYIQYYNRVINITPMDNKWIVAILDHRVKKEILLNYDAVFVCSGRYFHPVIPNIIGYELFQGLQMHSRDYRDPSTFANKRVLVIGGSFSAIDIAHQVSKVTKNICLSHRKSVTFTLPTVVEVKPEVNKFYESGVIFSDDTKKEFDVIIYCTGYKFHYPFLSKECGITIENNWIRYLYKHVINVENPSLYFIGVPNFSPIFANCDIQARFALAALEGRFILPSKQQMVEELENLIEKLKKENIPLKNIHKIGYQLDEYYEDLRKTAGIRPIPPVVTNLCKHYIQNLSNFLLEKMTTKRYVIIDNEHFLEIE